MIMHRHSTKLVAAVIVPFALAAMLAGCSSSGISGRLVFQDKNEAVNEGSADVPVWVPDDARTIVMDFSGDGSGYLMKFASHDGVAAARGCTAVAGDAPLQPTISTDWWPEDDLTDGRLACDDSQVARVGDEWYAWVKG
jgi:hypothetical protein